MGDYDSIYLVPKGVSHVNHRGNVDLESDFFGLYPIMSSPMAQISGYELVIEMSRNNCLGILHRFKSYSERIHDLEEVTKAGAYFGIAIGINDFEKELKIAQLAKRFGAVMIIVDIANGYLSALEEVGKRLRKELGDDIALMSGNIVTKEGAQHLLDSGFDWARVGIGPGSVCLTRSKTSIGRNQLAALKECSEIDINLVVDGGIKNPSDVIRSFYFGASFAMLGGSLAYAVEAENKEGEIHGMASRKNHINTGKEIKSIEGKEEKIDPNEKIPLKEILDDYLWGIRSACTYLGASSYKEIPYKAKAIPVNESIL